MEWRTGRPAGEAARHHRVLHPDPCLKAPGRSAVNSRNQTRRLPLDRTQAGRQGASFTRRGFDWTERYPRITEAVAALRPASVTIDGEAVMLRRHRRRRF